MHSIKLIIIFTLLLLNLKAKELDKITIQLDWLNQFQFAGYYIAKEKGFYKDENLDVTIKEYGFDSDAVHDVLNLKNYYGVGKSSLIIDRLEDKKVILLNAIYQNSPMVLITKKDSNINYPNELKDKKVMLTADARSAASINSMIISQGIELKDIKFQKHSFNLDDLINGKTDAMGCYLSNEPYFLEKRGIKYNILNPSDYGFDFYGGIFFTSQKELKNNPQRVRRVYKATMKGWEYAFNNIEDTAKLIYEKYNTQHKTLDSLIYEGKILKKLSKIDEGLLGNLDKKKIDEIKRLYVLLGFGKRNNSIPKSEEFIYNSSNIFYSKNQSDYLKNNKITLLSNDTFAPFTMVSAGELTGIEIDYWNLLLKRLKIKNSDIEIVNNPQESIEKVKENKNFVKYAFSKKDLSDKTTTTIPIIRVKIGIATLMDKPYISDITQLNGKRIALAKDALYAKQIKSNYPKIEFVDITDINEGLNLLKKRDVYGIVSKIPTLNYTISNKNLINIKIAGSFDERFEVKLLVNSENEMLLKLLNEAISTISQNDREIINSKYYSIIFQDKADYSNIYKVVIPLLIIIIFVIRSNRIMNKEIKRREEIEKELNKVANIDSLTNIYTRRKINTIFENEINRVRRYKRDLSVIFFDVDNFKFINDNLGHSVGDEVLVKLSNIVKANVRKTDYFGRWGGEEFLIILPETNKEQASHISNILKEKINSSDFNIDKKVTCSFGVTQFEETDSKDSILTRVDHAMYYVKENGKNNIKVV